MPTTDCATVVASSENHNPEIDHPQRSPGGASKSLRGVFYGFAATVTLGLALASWYVGVRIVAADEVAPSSAASIASAAPAASPMVAPLRQQALAAPAYVAPPVEFYLQVASLGRRQDARFVRSLRARGLRARVQTRNDHGSRILIGPFSNQADMELAQRKLQSAGVIAIEALVNDF